MNQDITHCSGHDLMGTTLSPIVCQKRDTCHRYRAYLDLEKEKSYQVPMLLPSDCMNDNHSLYWEEK